MSSIDSLLAQYASLGFSSGSLADREKSLLDGLTKRVCTTFGAGVNQTATGATADAAMRLPMKLPFKTTRWRLRVDNVNMSNGAAQIGAITIGNVYFGDAKVNASGRPDGAWNSAPSVACAGGLVPPDGTDLITPWVSDPTLQFSPYALKMLGITLTSTAGGNNVYTQGSAGLRNFSVGANAAIANVSGAGYAVNQTIMGIKLEYEYMGFNPIGLFVGDSLMESYNAAEDGGGVGLVSPHEAWPGVFGLIRKAATINAGIYGATTAPFLASNTWGFKRFDWANLTVPDFAMIHIGHNEYSAAGSDVSAAVIANIATVISAVRSLGISRIILGTMIPRGFGGGSFQEISRAGINTWIRGVPANVDAVYDMDIELRDPTNKLVTLPDTLSTDAIHLKRGGYQRLGQKFTIAN